MEKIQKNKKDQRGEFQGLKCVELTEVDLAEGSAPDLPPELVLSPDDPIHALDLARSLQSRIEHLGFEGERQREAQCYCDVPSRLRWWEDEDEGEVVIKGEN